jgi:hypothetical protein
MEHVEKRRAYVEECRQLYYDKNWNPTANRSRGADNGCLYRSAQGRNCAAGRLDPNANWVEDSIISADGTIDHNAQIALNAMQKQGLCSDDLQESLNWLRGVQIMHDDTYLAAKMYKILVSTENCEAIEWK